MYAVIETGGKQYRVVPGETLQVDRIPAEIGQRVEFDRVLAVQKEEGLVIGQPHCEGARVIGEVIGQEKERKIIIFKQKRRKNYRRKRGHRQLYTRLKIIEVTYGA